MARSVRVSGLRSRVRRFLQKPGSASLDGYAGLLPGIEAREPALRALSGAELTAAARDMDGDSEICAIGREAARRALGERPFDVQLLGTLALLAGQVAEMATGEGKTLSGALAAAGHARRGHRVQVMAVNDYLARRDAEWMRPVYDLLGVTASWIGQASTPQERRQAYAADICYASANEIGFDVLRDRLAAAPADLVTSEPDVVLIDEADSVLVDEALIPLVLAGAAGGTDTGEEMARIAGRLLPRLHYEVDDERRNVYLTDAGTRLAEQALGGVNLYAEGSLDLLTRLNVALHAEALLQRDVRLHRPGGPGPAGQRFPGPGRPAAALAGRPAGGGGGQGGPAAHRQRRDPGQHHDPVAGPAVPAGVRDDRHGGHGR